MNNYNPKGRHDAKMILLRFVLFIAGIAVLAVLLYKGGKLLEPKAEPLDADSSLRYQQSETITWNGATYRRRGNVTSFLLMGIDKPADAVSSGYRNGGQADFLRLVVMDTSAKTITQLQIDRDTITTIDVLGVMGNAAGTRADHIGLSHGYGDGKAQSCELTVKALKNLMPDALVDFYIAVNLDGIAVLNDAVGGVTVTLKDDFSMLDPAMTAGTTLTLMGQQAEIFTRTRKDISDGTNEARMARQSEYLSGFMTNLNSRLRENVNFIADAYDSLQPYLTTDIPKGRLINEVARSKDYTICAPIMIPGEYSLDSEGFMQFIADKAALEQIVMDLFYTEV